MCPDAGHHIGINGLWELGELGELVERRRRGWYQEQEWDCGRLLLGQAELLLGWVLQQEGQQEGQKQQQWPQLVLPCPPLAMSNFERDQLMHHQEGWQREHQWGQSFH